MDIVIFAAPIIFMVNLRSTLFWNKIASLFYLNTVLFLNPKQSLFTSSLNAKERRFHSEKADRSEGKRDEPAMRGRTSIAARPSGGRCSWTDWDSCGMRDESMRSLHGADERRRR